MSSFLPFLAGTIAVWFVSSMERPPIPEPLVFWNSDKLLHAAAYAVLGALALWGTSTRRSSLLAAARLEAFALAALYGVIDEIHQSFVPGRASSFADIIADSTGALLGTYAAASALVALRRSRG